MVLRRLPGVVLSAPLSVLQDPRDPNDQQEILRKLDGCEFDVIFDVRSHHYYENWRLAGGEHMPDATQFDPERLATQNITSVAFYCWNDPWESEPAAQWFAQQYGDQGVQVYDIKGLAYLDDVPGMCQYIDGDEEAIAMHSPHCVEEGGVGRRSGTNRCNPEQLRDREHEDCHWWHKLTKDPKVLFAVILCTVGLMTMAIVACWACKRGGDDSVPDVSGKLDDPWSATEGKQAKDDLDDCEMCKAGLTGIVPAAPVIGVADGTYPPNLPGTPDSDEAESSVGAHGLAVTRWESSEEEPFRDEHTQDTQDETARAELQEAPKTEAEASP